MSKKCPKPLVAKKILKELINHYRYGVKFAKYAKYDAKFIWSTHVAPGNLIKQDHRNLGADLNCHILKHVWACPRTIN